MLGAAVADAIALGDEDVDVQAHAHVAAKAISHTVAHKPPSLRSW